METNELVEMIEVWQPVESGGEAVSTLKVGLVKKENRQLLEA